MKNKKNDIIVLSTYLLMFIGLLLCMALFNSCKSVENVKVIHDTIRHYQVKEVPVVVHDSVYHTQYVEVFTKGDTVYRQTFVQDKVYVEIPVEVHDTIIDEKVVNVPVEVIKEKEVKVKGFFYWFGIIMSIMAVVGLATGIYFCKIEKGACE